MAKQIFKIWWGENAVFPSIIGCVSIALAIAGFLCPPLGEIHNSVLIVIGELGFLYTVSKLPAIIKAVAETHTAVKIQKGDTNIEVKANNEED